MLVVILLFLIILIGVLYSVLFLKNKQKTNIILNVRNRSEYDSPKIDTIKDDIYNIEVEVLPQTYEFEENKLLEVTDKQVLSRISMMIPGLIGSGNAAANLSSVLQHSGETLYRAVLPSGAKLANSSSMSGASRGIYHGANGISGHANFVPVDSSKSTTVLTNSVAGLMSIASVVVGQYYMSQINDQLDGIQSNLDKLLTLEQNKYRSKIVSLITQVKVLTDFKMESIENKELRKSAIDKLSYLENDCTKILAQANIELEELIKIESLNYDHYEKQVLEIQKWYDYQKLLLKTLSTISELQYTLNLGNQSRERSEALYEIFADKTKIVNDNLRNWHNKEIDRLNIDISRGRRERDGIDKVFLYIPGMINQDLNYVEIPTEISELIQNQKLEEHDEHIDNSDYYNQDVQLISRNGKLYYLPQ